MHVSKSGRLGRLLPIAKRRDEALTEIARTELQYYSAENMNSDVQINSRFRIGSGFLRFDILANILVRSLVHSVSHTIHIRTENVSARHEVRHRAPVGERIAGSGHCFSCC